MTRSPPCITLLTIIADLVVSLGVVSVVHTPSVYVVMHCLKWKKCIYDTDSTIHSECIHVDGLANFYKVKLIIAIKNFMYHVKTIVLLKES